MLRGLLSGVSLGAIVSAGVLSVASVVSPPPMSAAPPPITPSSPEAAPAPEAASEPADEAAEMDESPSQTDDMADMEDAAEPSPSAEVEDAPSPEADMAEADPPAAPAAEEEPAPAPPPTTSEVAELPEAPEAGTSAELAESPSEETDLTQGDAPEAPAADSDPVVGTETLTPPALAETPGLGDAPDGDPAPGGLAVPLTDPPSGQPATLDAPASDQLALAQPAETAEPQVGAAPDAPAAPETGASLEIPEASETEPATTEPPLLVEPSGEAAPAADTAAPTPPPADEEPAEIPEGAIVVDIIEDDPAEDAPAAEEDTEDDSAPSTRFALSSETGSGLPGQQVSSVIGAGDAGPAAETDTSVASALEQFGAGVPSDGRPLISVLLLDTGDIPNAIEVLNTLPMQVTVGVDPESATATETAAAYRAAGIEVAIISPIPPRATAQDVAVAFDAAFAILPEAAMVVDTGNGGLSGISPTDFAMELFAERGLGFATVSRGLNAAVRAADEVGVPAGVFSRDLDAEDQDARVIRRFLERSVFQARQGEDVALIARLRPDTVSALILWATASQLDTVQVAPVSTLLLKQNGDG